MKAAGLAQGFSRAACSICRPRPVRITANARRFAPVLATSFSTSTRRRDEDDKDVDGKTDWDDGSLGSLISAAPPINEENYIPASQAVLQAPAETSVEDSTPRRREPDEEGRGLAYQAGGQDIALENLRIVPASPSYFTSIPQFWDSFLEVERVLRKYESLPQIEPINAPKVAWIQVESFRSGTNESVKIAKWRKLQKLLQRLNYIHPEVMPEEVQAIIQKFKKPLNPYNKKTWTRSVDDLGRGMGVGRRKTSSAVAWLIEGEGEVLINSKSLSQHFTRIHDRESAIWALKATDRIDKYNVWALVRGGGTTGQAEALTLAVAKALMVHEPALKPVLRRAGCVTRDPRMVERKKPGKLKARKMPAWVKR